MPPTLIYHDFHDKVIRQRASDGYLDATAICKTTGKKSFSDYQRLQNTKDFLSKLSVIIGLPIKKSVKENQGLIEIIQGGYPENQGTWVHPKVAENLYAWASIPRQIEKVIQSRLQIELGGQTEVKTPAGKIDLLTDTQLIEIKAGKYWKQAIGQVIIYGSYYPKHQKRIHLFSNEPPAPIDEHCSQLGIELTREQHRVWYG